MIAQLNKTLHIILKYLSTPFAFHSHRPSWPLFFDQALVHHDHGIRHGEEVTRSTDHQNGGNAKLFEEWSDLSLMHGQSLVVHQKCHLLQKTYRIKLAIQGWG